MHFSQNASQKNMMISNKSKSSLKYSLTNKSKKIQYGQINHHYQNNHQKKINYSSAYMSQVINKDKNHQKTQNYVSTIEDQSMFNCLQNSKTVLKFNQISQVGVSQKEFTRHNKNPSQFSGYSSKLNTIRFNTKPISQNNVGILSSQKSSNLSYLKNLNKIIISNHNDHLYLQTETCQKYSLKKKDNFQLKIKTNCYPCYKYSDIAMPTKKITKEQLRSIEDFKYLVTKNKKQNQFSRMLCNNFSKLRDDDGCQCFPKCLWINRWMNMFQHQPYNNSSLSSSRNQSHYSQIMNQIQKDIPRTQVNTSYLSQNKNRQKLRQILQNYAQIDPNVGYVQGMNIIASVVIYHSVCIVTANELFTHLMRNAGLRKIYLNDLSLSQDLNKQMMRQLKNISYDLYGHLTSQQIDLNMFISTWYFSLMGMFIPLQQMHYVFDKFFRKSWSGINEIIITYLLLKKQTLMNKFNQQLYQCFSIKSLQQECKTIDWQELFVRSQNLLLPKIKM